ncbi:MAG: carbon storage regulator [Planctomyces sp.]
MLVLSRQSDETIVIGDNIRVTIVEVRGDKVRIGIEAPRDFFFYSYEI